MTEQQLYLAIGVPTLAILITLATNARWFSSIDARVSSIDARLSAHDTRFVALEKSIADLRLEVARNHADLLAKLSEREHRIIR